MGVFDSLLIDARHAPAKLIQKRDEADEEYLRLTPEQAQELLQQPRRVWPKQRLRYLRDTAALALALATGVREAELCALTVADLRAELGGELSLKVREGKGSVQRLIPYGGMSWVLIVVDRWLCEAEIVAGPVFRGFRRNNTTVRPEAMTPKTFERMLADYPMVIKGKLRKVNPHDLRRTYARMMYEAWLAGVGGLPIEAIQQNMGHQSIDQTRAYIGTLDAKTRRPGKIFTFDLGVLE